MKFPTNSQAKYYRRLRRKGSIWKVALANLKLSKVRQISVLNCGFNAKSVGIFSNLSSKFYLNILAYFPSNEPVGTASLNGAMKPSEMVNSNKRA